MSINVKRVNKTFKVERNRRTINLTKRPKTFSIHDGGRRGLPGESDKHFEQDFSPTAFFSVTHNLNKKPAVTVIDSAGTEVVGDVSHISNNQLTVSFEAAFGGKVICN